MVKSACGIEAVYMCFNGTGIWGGETIKQNVTFRERMPFKNVRLNRIQNGRLSATIYFHIADIW